MGVTKNALKMEMLNEENERLKTYRIETNEGVYNLKATSFSIHPELGAFFYKNKTMIAWEAEATRIREDHQSECT